jgi:hypothetical protein
MNKRSMPKMLAALIVLASVCLTGTVFAQDAGIYGQARPMFKVLPPHEGTNAYMPPSANLPQWTFTFTYNGNTYNDVFVGTNPATTNTTTTIHWGIIPLKMVYGSSNGNKTFDPNTIYSGNQTATQMIANSIIFKSLVDYNQGGTDLGKTQYEDAYTRGNFWGDVKTNTSYHLLFANAVIAPDQTLNVPAGDGSVISNPWSGIPTGTADINWFDAQLQPIMAHFKQIQPNTLPIFLSYNVYLTEGGCCIGGYHAANGIQPSGQTYMWTATISQAANPVFSQDVGALSHEVGEWILDPFTDNNSPCGIMENGDPLETEPNFGDFPYTVNGFTYHPQDLVFVDYFGAPASLAVNGWHTFQNETNANGVCSRGSN